MFAANWHSFLEHAGQKPCSSKVSLHSPLQLWRRYPPAPQGTVKGGALQSLGLGGLLVNLPSDVFAETIC